MSGRREMNSRELPSRQGGNQTGKVTSVVETENTPFCKPEQVWDLEDDAMGPPPGTAIHQCPSSGTSWFVDTRDAVCPVCGTTRAYCSARPCFGVPTDRITLFGHCMKDSVVAASSSRTLSQWRDAFLVEIGEEVLYGRLNQLGEWFADTRVRLVEENRTQAAEDTDPWLNCDTRWVEVTLGEYLRDMLTDHSDEMIKRITVVIRDVFFGR